MKQNRLLITLVLLGAYLLSACSGASPQQASSSPPSSDSGPVEVVFTGTVDSVGDTQWLISGESVGIDGSTVVGSNIQPGQVVKVEAVVLQDGKILALQIESSNPDDSTNANDNSANDNSANDNTANANDDNINSNGNNNINGNDNSNSNDVTGVEQEVSGVVQSLTADSVTINGVTYKFADSIEIKDIILVGDQVKLHLVVTADGTILVREIEKATTLTNGDDNSNDDDDNGNINSNGNSNDDDHDDDNGNGNSNDDNDNTSNSNDNN